MPFPIEETDIQQVVELHRLRSSLDFVQEIQQEMENIEASDEMDALKKVQEHLLKTNRIKERKL